MCYFRAPDSSKVGEIIIMSWLNESGSVVEIQQDSAQSSQVNCFIYLTNNLRRSFVPFKFFCYYTSLKQSFGAYIGITLSVCPYIF